MSSAHPTFGSREVRRATRKLRMDECVIPREPLIVPARIGKRLLRA